MIEAVSSCTLSKKRKPGVEILIWIFAFPYPMPEYSQAVLEICFTVRTEVLLLLKETVALAGRLIRSSCFVSPSRIFFLYFKILTDSRGEDFDKIMGLDIGADDYIVKPFSPNEVMARLRAVLRRLQKPEDMINNENIIHISNMTVNLEEYTFKVNGERIPLTKKEIETMWTLASNPNKVFTRDNLLDSLWGYDYYGDSRTVDSHIKRLRAKLDSVEHPDWTIKTIWGVGYKFEISEENF